MEITRVHYQPADSQIWSPLGGKLQYSEMGDGCCQPAFFYSLSINKGQTKGQQQEDKFLYPENMVVLTEELD